MDTSAILEANAPPLSTTFLPALPIKNSKPHIALNGISVDAPLFESPIGSIFLGHHLGLDIPIVIRVLNPVMKSVMENYDQFVIEHRKFSQVRHPNIAAFFDTGEIEGHVFAVSEFMSGIPLIERIKSKHFDEYQALEILIPIGYGLVEIWNRNLVHRGVSPHFIYVNNEGISKLDSVPLRGKTNEPVIKEFFMPKMAAYWSPEEVRADAPVDIRSDMWSYGATLYHAVTGVTPFSAKNHEGMMLQTLTAEPRPPHVLNDEICKPLSDFIMRLLHKNPNKRFPSAHAFHSALRALEAMNNQCQLASASSQTEVMAAPGTIDEGSLKTEVQVNSKSRASIAAPQSPVADPGVGELIGNCVLEEKVGSGAFGVVWRARHQMLDIDVAVKLLPAQMAKSNSRFVDMFLREARLAARLRHPNIISIFEAGQARGQYYIIMEFAGGGTVWQWMDSRGGRLNARETVPILLATARGLGAAGRLNIVHRDIKPENLMFTTTGELKIADLGLAKRSLSPEAQAMATASMRQDLITQMDNANTVSGTPAYMAPEMATSPDTVDPRADLYSLGVTGFQILTGQFPITGNTPLEVLMNHIGKPPADILSLDSHIPPDLAAIIMRLLNKNPKDRYPSGDALTADLEKIYAQQARDHRWGWY